MHEAYAVWIRAISSQRLVKALSKRVVHANKSSLITCNVIDEILSRK